MSDEQQDDDNSWNEVEAEEDVVSQIRKIEYEQEARRKLSAKDFPLRVNATADDSSSSNSSGEKRMDTNAGNNVQEEEVGNVKDVEATDEAAVNEENQEQPAAIKFPPLSTTVSQASNSRRVPLKMPQIKPLVLYPTATTTNDIHEHEPSPARSLPAHNGAPTPTTTTLPTPKTRLQFSPLALPPASTDGFAQILKERTRQRRAQEDAAVSAVRVQVARLEAALAAESKRRVAAVQLLHEQATQAAEDMQTQLKQQLQDELQSVHARLDRLEERMGGLEQKYEQEMMALRHDIVRDSERIHAQMRTLQGQVAREEQKLQTRHKQSMDHMQSVADSYLDRWKEERQARLTAVQTLNETMQTVHSSRAQNLASFEGQLSYELEQLKLAVQTESGERQMYDQEIVDALNRYIQQLQESLAQAVTQGRVY